MQTELMNYGGRCFYCYKAGLDVDMILSEGYAYSMSVERINSDMGYGRYELTN